MEEARPDQSWGLDGFFFGFPLGILWLDTMGDSMGILVTGT